MNILITGGTGFLGRHLIEPFVNAGHTVSVFSRNKKNEEGIKTFFWNPSEHILDEQALKEADCIIHLAGASLADGRWTKKRKKEIIDSRVQSGELLLEHLAKNRHRIKTFISASGIGIYGNTGDQWIDESSEAANGFLSEVCKQWEAVAYRIASLNIRTVVIRIGLVLSGDGGALPVMATPFRFYAGSPLGSGKQYISWIHIDDLCNIFLKATEDDSMQGTYNAVAPNPCTNKEFMKTLAPILRKPLMLPAVPSFVLKGLLGEKASIVLEGQRVTSAKLLSTGFRFQFRELADALRNIYEP